MIFFTSINDRMPTATLTATYYHHPHHHVDRESCRTAQYVFILASHLWATGTRTLIATGVPLHTPRYTYHNRNQTSTLNANNSKMKTVGRQGTQSRKFSSVQHGTGNTRERQSAPKPWGMEQGGTGRISRSDCLRLSITTHHHYSKI